MPQQTSISESRCPQCNAKLDTIADPTAPDARFKPGDYVVCIECGIILILSADLSPRPPSGAEWHAVICNRELFVSLKKLQLKVLSFIQWQKQQKPPLKP